MYALRAYRGSWIAGCLLGRIGGIIVGRIGMLIQELRRDDGIPELLEKALILGPAKSGVHRTLYKSP